MINVFVISMLQQGPSLVIYLPKHAVVFIDSFAPEAFSVGSCSCLLVFSTLQTLAGTMLHKKCPDCEITVQMQLLQHDVVFTADTVYYV